MTFPFEILHQTQNNVASHVTFTNTCRCFIFGSIRIFTTIDFKVIYKLWFQVCQAPHLHSPLLRLVLHVLACRAITPFVPDHHLIYSNILFQIPLPHACSSKVIHKPSHLPHLIIAQLAPSFNIRIWIYNVKAFSDLLKSIT